MATRDDLERDNRIGRWLIRERIVTGAMGTVFRAVDTVLDRVVAPRTILPDRVAETSELPVMEILDRFRREAQAVARSRIGMSCGSASTGVPPASRRTPVPFGSARAEISWLSRLRAPLISRNRPTAQGDGTHTVMASLADPATAVLPAMPEAAVPDRSLPSRDQGDSPWTGRRLGGAALIAVGIASLAVGVTLIFLHGKETCMPQKRFGCDGQRGSRTAGFAYGGPGLGSGIAGGLLLGGHKSGLKLGLSVRPGPGVAMSGRF